ncbi:hypothetical protein K503DRAFT_583797 [Rhizopogon vinicolor AM-OR11-026]|uniref:Secreted protein n=1 Tax=Rhizopogon vinicolor AM-OR11-026 TaxID=1314800 RepID=A0A1B7MJJ3_9AGAM|nr:hypothetical protein K503DRAFT_583797 [Rhizopogon vinicolor AM-OR11-026]
MSFLSPLAWFFSKCLIGCPALDKAVQAHRNSPALDSTALTGPFLWKNTEFPDGPMTRTLRVTLSASLASTESHSKSLGKGNDMGSSR